MPFNFSLFFSPTHMTPKRHYVDPDVYMWFFVPLSTTNIFSPSPLLSSYSLSRPSCCKKPVAEMSPSRKLCVTHEPVHYDRQVLNREIPLDRDGTSGRKVRFIDPLTATSQCLHHNVAHQVIALTETKILPLHPTPNHQTNSY